MIFFVDLPENIWYFENFCVFLQEISDIWNKKTNFYKRSSMTTLNIQAAQNDIIRQVLNTQDIHLLDRIRNLFANKEADEACMVQEEPCMTKEEILSGFDNALHELKSYREGKLELKPLEDVLNEL